MLVQGIVAEYNPFHNGHLHHIRASQEITGADATVIVMSGTYVQRGEPAIFSKLARTEMALCNGVDLVLELPFAFSCASAETFAYGAVSTLEATGIVDSLTFGSESGRLSSLSPVADFLIEEPEVYRHALHAYLNQGLSYPVARQTALKDTFPSTHPEQAIDAHKLLASPNNILAVEYLKALRFFHSTIAPITIKRKGSGYHDLHMDDALPSASAIRASLFNRESTKGIADFVQRKPKNIPGLKNDDEPNIEPNTEPNELIQGIPYDVMVIIQREMDAGRGPVFSEVYTNILLQRLRCTAPEDLTGLPWMETGLEYRLIAAAQKAETMDELLSAVASSRYPKTRIQRICTAAIIGMTASLQKSLSMTGYAQYIRVLGFSSKGQSLLSEMRKKAKLPIIGKSSLWGTYENPLIHELLTLECRASDTWALACKNSADRKGGNEHRLRPIRL